MHTQVAMRNAHWGFLQVHTHPLMETCSRGSCNSPEFDLGNFSASKESLLSESLQKTLQILALNTC